MLAEKACAAPPQTLAQKAPSLNISYSIMALMEQVAVKLRSRNVSLSAPPPPKKTSNVSPDIWDGTSALQGAQVHAVGHELKKKVSSIIVMHTPSIIPAACAGANLPP
jgi:hypothetical protein